MGREDTVTRRHGGRAGGARGSLGAWEHGREHWTRGHSWRGEGVLGGVGVAVIPEIAPAAVIVRNPVALVYNTRLDSGSEPGVTENYTKKEHLPVI